MLDSTQDILTWVVEYVTNEMASLDLSEIYEVQDSICNIVWRQLR